MLSAVDFTDCPCVRTRAYNGASGKKIAVTYTKKLDEEEKVLAEAVRWCSRCAVQQTFAAELSVTVGRNGKLIENDLGGTESSGATE